MSETEGVKATTEKVEAFRQDFAKVRAEVGKVIVGHEAIVEGVLTCLIAGGHALLEGVPGLGKTLLVRTLARALELEFSRVQFTPDLMPADILGTQVITEDQHGHKRFEFQRGPLFANLVLADEVNRATPKTQSALLEAMQEHSVTVARQTHLLDEPFFVLATQNPLEMEGTYPLPEAQLDRFFFKLQVLAPNKSELRTILDRTTGTDDTVITPVLDHERLLALRALARSVPVSDTVKDFAVRLVLATQPEGEGATPSVRRFVRYGSSPRGAQAVLLAAKIKALTHGRFSPSIDDLRESALPALRHRLIMNFEGEAEGVKTDTVITELLGSVKPTA